MVAPPMEDTGSLTVEIAIGLDAEAHLGLVLPMETTLMGSAFSTGCTGHTGRTGHPRGRSPHGGISP
jgi:hypothetical protein